MRPGQKLASCVLLAAIILASHPTFASSVYDKWSMGPSKDPGYFPIAVWLQSPRNAAKYKAAGINVYIGLWKGPTEDQLAQLKQAGMPVICSQNSVGLAHKDDPIIIAWMHGDEPDNAQSLGSGKGYGPPIPPATIVSDYEEIRKTDPSRPVILNLGQGVAWDRWHGRGVRTNHPEDYPQYIKGSDIVSFDIYPAVHDKPEVAGNLWFVAQGVQRLMEWSEGERIVWNCIECTHISNPDRIATPEEVRAEVWMSIIHGSRGLIYFVHQFQPRFNESALLSDPQMLEAVTKINHQITELAAVINADPADDLLTVETANPQVPIAATSRRTGSDAYLFTVAMRKGQTAATFQLANLPGKRQVEVLGENRTLTCTDGRFEDDFGPWEVHLYQVKSKK